MTIERAKEHLRKYERAKKKGGVSKRGVQEAMSILERPFCSLNTQLHE